MPTISLRIDAELGERLERLANETRRTKSFLAVEAIREYVELQEWQILGIRDAMARADAGELVGHEQVESWLKTWGTRDEQEPPK
ncbi:MAG: CopG family ribbon-helix-helix protein [Gammaproteobacteria bacterium]